MKRLFTIFTAVFAFLTVSAQVEHSIILDQSTFRAVQKDALTGVNVDPIGLDHSRQACARVKIKFDRMNKAQIDALEVKMRSNTDLTKQKVADYYDNVLILEMTAKPNTRFYFYSPEFGESNEVTLNLEGNREYEMLASLNQAFSIVVESNVVGADVYIDGVFKGQTGDNKKCTISDVMIGEHRLKVVYGSASSEKLIDVNKNAISFAQNVNIAATEPQYVVFAVEPKTASVIIGDKPLTPDEGGVVTTVLQAGTYSYSVSAKMYHSQSGTFTVAGAKVQKSVALAPAFGYLSVGGGMVNGATVFVNDENIGTAPVKSDKLASGEHSVRIVKDKYKPYSTTVTVRDSETTTLAPTLSADFATVTLTTASGATIWINGVEKGSGSWSGELSTGTYIFEARQSGHRSAQISKTIAATPSRQSYAIPAPTPIVGSVDITSSPAMADITLDGKAVGTTPLKLSSLLVGEHKITVSKSGYQPYTTTVTIAEGRTATVNATLTKQVAQAPSTPSSGSANFGDIEMVFVKGGTFTMGATSEQGSDAYSDETPTHSVTLSDFYIGKYEVTQAQWRAVMGNNPSYFKGDNLPVECVSWNDIQKFIKKLNAQTGKNFRLPTEAEWEYAARGGNQSRGYKYSGSNDRNNAWYKDNSSSKTHPVGQKQPNELGIYDMSGNVWEWCQDWYGSYSSSSQTNHTGPSSGSARVLRGGGWSYFAWYCRVSFRYGSPDSSSSDYGFRLVCSPE